MQGLGFRAFKQRTCSLVILRIALRTCLESICMRGVLISWVRSVLADPTVKFVREALTKAGCPVADKFFKPEHCSMKVGGGFKQEDGVRSLTLFC